MVLKAQEIAQQWKSQQEHEDIVKSLKLNDMIKKAELVRSHVILLETEARTLPSKP